MENPSAKPDGDRSLGPVPPNPYLPETTLPPLLVQAFSSFTSIQPLPLHAFLPLQALSAPPQAPLPLQSLTPEHFTVFAAALSLSPLACAFATNKPATADAITAPFTTFLSIRPLLVGFGPIRPLWTV